MDGSTYSHNPFLETLANEMEAEGTLVWWKISSTPAGRTWWAMRPTTSTKQNWTTPTVFDASSNQPGRLRPSRVATGRKTDYISRQVRIIHGDGVLSDKWVGQLMGAPDGWLEGV